MRFDLSDEDWALLDPLRALSAVYDRSHRDDRLVGDLDPFDPVASIGHLFKLEES